MAEVKSYGVRTIDLEALRVSVISSSTSHRQAELHALENQLTNTGKRLPGVETLINSNRRLTIRLRGPRCLGGATP